MSRPDAEYLRRNAAVVFAGNGEAAKLRSYVSGTTGQAKFGVADTFNYIETRITGLFARIVPIEAGQAGGLTQATQFGVTTTQAVGARDEIIWNGTAYRLDGNPTPVTLGGRVMWRSPLRMAGATG